VTAKSGTMRHKIAFAFLIRQTLVAPPV
jgi:hypothetical protein